MEDLFGESATPVGDRFLKHIPFTDNEAELVLEDAPGILLGEVGDCIKAMRAEKNQFIPMEVINSRLSAAKKRFFRNVDWMFDLSERPAALPFDTACDLCEIDSDVIRCRVSSEFGNEIRQFYAAYAAVNANDAIRVARKLRLFVDLSH